jgi:hypothetical protein
VRGLQTAALSPWKSIGVFRSPLVSRIAGSRLAHHRNAFSFSGETTGRSAKRVVPRQGGRPGNGSTWTTTVPGSTSSSATGNSGAVYNIGGEGQENLAVTQLIVELTGCDAGLVRHVEDRPGHDRRYSVDSARLSALGWTPHRLFEEGLAENGRVVSGPPSLVGADQVRRVPEVLREPVRGAVPPVTTSLRIREPSSKARAHCGRETGIGRGNLGLVHVRFRVTRSCGRGANVCAHRRSIRGDSQARGAGGRRSRQRGSPRATSSAPTRAPPGSS